MQDTVKKQRILVVEDDAELRQVLGFFLRHADLDVLDVASGIEAIRVIPEYCPNLIILDLMMLPITGWEVLQWVRDVHGDATLPVLLLSARVHFSEQIRGFEEGAVEYLTKPTQPSRVVERVRTILSLSAEQRLLRQRKRIEDQRKMLARLHDAQVDEHDL